jgi:copper(I)-binding protein
MKNSVFVTLILIALTLNLLSGCSSGEEQQPQPDITERGRIQIEESWARPASEGRMSAAYFLLTNFDSEADTLLSVESDVAELVEVHESYESEEGMMGMREVPELEIPAQSTLRFQQGGLHIMLIQVTRALEDGDSFDLTLNFSRTGSQTISIPVRL